MHITVHNVGCGGRYNELHGNAGTIGASGIWKIRSLRRAGVGNVYGYHHNVESSNLGARVAATQHYRSLMGEMVEEFSEE